MFNSANVQKGLLCKALQRPLLTGACPATSLYAYLGSGLCPPAFDALLDLGVAPVDDKEVPMHCQLVARPRARKRRRGWKLDLAPALGRNVENIQVVVPLCLSKRLVKATKQYN